MYFLNEVDPDNDIFEQQEWDEVLGETVLSESNDIIYRLYEYNDVVIEDLFPDYLSNYLQPTD